ncbi:hypothetical protein KC480_05970 [Bacillus velezensis]|uniref:hypothetical protein n=1 Tax=Bacillus velezensis TaxID=492670 RepID=UPI001E5886F8|nr:hypothetical protein [Bacillus velezensis]MCD7911072.1 hypothetical protein [Bacillus velezensis]
MELASAYLYNRVPVNVDYITEKTFHYLKRNGWYTDTRTNSKFTMLNKRIEIKDKWYRVLIRFEVKKSADSSGTLTPITYKLSEPAPFLVTECEPIDSVTTGKWKDSEVFHGRKLGSVLGFLEKGIPTEIIDTVYSDLKKHIDHAAI